MKRKLLVVGAFALTAAMGVSLGASPVMKDIQAKLNPTIQYEIDGKSVMEDDAGIVFEDKIYIPLRAAGEALGLNVHYEPGKVTLTSKEEVVEEDVVDEDVVDEDVVDEDVVDKDVVDEDVVDEDVVDEDVVDEDVVDKDVVDKDVVDKDVVDKE